MTIRCAGSVTSGDTTMRTLLTAGLLALVASNAQAQDLVMRRPLPIGNGISSTPDSVTPTPTPAATPTPSPPGVPTNRIGMGYGYSLVCSQTPTMSCYKVERSTTEEPLRFTPVAAATCKTAQNEDAVAFVQTSGLKPGRSDLDVNAECGVVPDRCNAMQQTCSDVKGSPLTAYGYSSNCSYGSITCRAVIRAEDGGTTVEDSYDYGACDVPGTEEQTALATKYGLRPAGETAYSDASNACYEPDASTNMWGRVCGSSPRVDCLRLGMSSEYDEDGQPTGATHPYSSVQDDAACLGGPPSGYEDAYRENVGQLGYQTLFASGAKPSTAACGKKEPAPEEDEALSRKVVITSVSKWKPWVYGEGGYQLPTEASPNLTCSLEAFRITTYSCIETDGSTIGAADARCQAAAEALARRHDAALFKRYESGSSLTSHTFVLGSRLYEYRNASEDPNTLLGGCQMDGKRIWRLTNDRGSYGSYTPDPAYSTNGYWAAWVPSGVYYGNYGYMENACVVTGSQQPSESGRSMSDKYPNGAAIEYEYNYQLYANGNGMRARTSWGDQGVVAGANTVMVPTLDPANCTLGRSANARWWRLEMPGQPQECVCRNSSYDAVDGRSCELDTTQCIGKP